ncbi:hypothetical protein [Paludisphaera mucosa]|uniref:Glycosyltransferase RgtA/B/C/D-like domain-containing protein n=1 Tax=Paludisphaera mucosa TaxID=3030827 RepID=A0ABT6F660_9BACT|nr:hypothetical protein [Paludisphaera mucosa]MDG3003078.1 hypothetical protein [Paludisphaera mucosa]
MIAAVVREFPQPEAARVQFPNQLKPDSYESFWMRDRRTPRSIAPGSAEAVALASHEVRLYQAQHSWWYYVIVSPVFQALGGVDDLRNSVAGLRLLNLAFTVGAVWIALGVVAARVSDPRTAGWIVLMIGVQPLMVTNGIRVSSDAAGVFFSIAAVAQMIKLAVDDRRLVRGSCLVGLFLSLAIVMKATNFALLPAVGVAWTVAVLRSRPPVLMMLGSAAVIVGAVAALIGPDLVHNLNQYGIATPMQEALENRSKGRGLPELYNAFREFHSVAYGRWLFGQGLFIAGNWSFVLPIDDVLSLHGLFLKCAALGLILSTAAGVIRGGLARVGLVFKSGQVERKSPIDALATPLICLTVCVGFLGALIYHAVQSALAWGVTTTGPWYASPAIPWFLLLVGMGASGWPRFVAAGLVAGVVFLSLAAEHSMWWLQMLPFYSGGAQGLEALRRITSLQPWYLSMTTCAAAMTVGLVLFASAVRAIGLAGRDIEGFVLTPHESSPAARPSWLNLVRKRERIDARSDAVPAPSVRMNQAAPEGSPRESTDWDEIPSSR